MTGTPATQTGARIRVGDVAGGIDAKQAHRDYPHSRTDHQVFNVRPGAICDGPLDEESAVWASFAVWRHRNGRAVSHVGQYHCRLVAGAAGPLIRSKRVVTDMTELRPAGDLAIIL